MLQVVPQPDPHRYIPLQHRSEGRPLWWQPAAPPAPGLPRPRLGPTSGPPSPPSPFTLPLRPHRLLGPRPGSLLARPALHTAQTALPAHTREGSDSSTSNTVGNTSSITTNTVRIKVISSNQMGNKIERINETDKNNSTHFVANSNYTANIIENNGNPNTIGSESEVGDKTASYTATNTAGNSTIEINVESNITQINNKSTASNDEVSPTTKLSSATNGTILSNISDGIKISNNTSSNLTVSLGMEDKVKRKVGDMKDVSEEPSSAGSDQPSLATGKSELVRSVTAPAAAADHVSDGEPAFPGDLPTAAG